METATTDSERSLASTNAGPVIGAHRRDAVNVFFRRVTEGVTAAMMLAMLVIFVLQVGFRYFLNKPLPWTDEATTLLFPWLVFWGCCFLVPINGNVRFDIIYNAMGHAVRRALLVISSLIVLAVFVWALPKTWEYIDYMWRHRTPMLKLRYFWVFLCYALFMVVMILRAGWTIWLVASKDERAEHV